MGLSLLVFIDAAKFIQPGSSIEDDFFGLGMNENKLAFLFLYPITILGRKARKGGGFHLFLPCRGFYLIFSIRQRESSHP